MALFSKLFTGANDREVKKLSPLLDEVNDLEAIVKGSGSPLRRARPELGTLIDTLLG